MRALKTAFLAAAVAVGLTGAAHASSEAIHLPSVDWPHGGIFGTFDRAAAQRGFQVYKEVCASCHAMTLLSYRNLAGIGFSEDQIKAIAATVEVTAGPNDNGDMFKRPGLPSDRFVSPFPNEQAARVANGGALPPDLSLMAKARFGGEDYIYALLTGYEDPPAGFNLMPGMNYNKYFPGHQIAMPSVLSDGQVTYEDGTEATVDRMSKDVATFLTYAAEPHMEARKRAGIKTILFLLIFAGLMYATKRTLWAGADH